MDYGPDEEVPIYQASQEYRHEYSGHRRQKVFNDSVHGHFQLHRASVAIVDTPEFQRLRHLKQLGLAYKIFPSASHNRFEHSLGVAHLATEWGSKLITSRDGVGEDGWQRSRLEPEDRQYLTVLQITGLTHDLGHGPFSHVFEKELLPRLGLAPEIVKTWEHETMSNRILDHISDSPENNIDLQELAHLNEDHIDLIKALMHGSKDPQRAYPSAPWLFDVVANKRNGIDVDKFDYLERDAMMCGVGVPLDAKRLMLFSRVSPDRQQVVFKQTEYNNLAVGLFQSRAEMHRRVYTHTKIKSVEFMVCDAIALAAGPLGLKEALGSDGDLQAYINLDDSILQQIMRLVPDAYEVPAAVRQAQALLQQLERRNLYKFVSEVTLNYQAQQNYAAGGAGKPSAEEIVACQSTAETGVRLDPADVIVCEIHIDQGMKAQNPMDMVRFYQTSDPEGGDEPFAMPQQSVTSMLGTVYQDKLIRVYSKNTDPAVCKALKHAFTQWSQKRHNCQPPGTPWRQPATYNHQQQQQQQSYQQPLPRAPPSSSERPAGRAASAAGLAQSMFGGSADSNGSGNGSGDPQHMGSGGRSRKRSLVPDMAAASQSSQEQQQGSQGSQPVSKFARLSATNLADIPEEDGL